MVIVSLGAGVQSSVLLLLACQGKLPKPDYAIFADTQWESPAVYYHLWWLAEQANSANIPVIIASKGNIRTDAVRSTNPGADGMRWASMPLFTKADGKESIGMIRRQCTKEYKLEVVKSTIRSLLGLQKGERVPAEVEVRQYIGISIDEKNRMRLSRDRWIVNEYPLIGWPIRYFDRPWTRAMCQAWFAQQYPGRTLPRSACIGCPLRNNREWREMKSQRPHDWTDAIVFDRQIRRIGGMRGETFVHRSCVPLEAVDFSVDETQLSFECTGMCGV